LTILAKLAVDKQMMSELEIIKAPVAAELRDLKNTLKTL